MGLGVSVNKNNKNINLDTLGIINADKFTGDILFLEEFFFS